MSHSKIILSAGIISYLPESLLLRYTDFSHNKRLVDFNMKLRPLLIILALSCPLVGCTEYWWQRGQPPSVKTLMTRATTDFETAIAMKKRPELVPLAQSLEGCLKQVTAEAGRSATSPNNKLNESLMQCKSDFISLEDHLSVTNRASYGELAGQLRVFVDGASLGKAPDPSAFGLFTARTLFFLASELELSKAVAKS